MVLLNWALFDQGDRAKAGDCCFRTFKSKPIFPLGWLEGILCQKWGSKCRKALILKGTIKKRKKIWMRSWSVVNEGKRSAKTSFGWKRRFVRERPTTARRPTPPRARGDAFICFLMWAGGGDQKRLGSSDDNSAIKSSPGQTCSVAPGQFQMGDLHTCSLLGSSIVLKLESSQLNISSHAFLPWLFLWD